MGLYERWQRSRRIKKAAEEMWNLIRGGVNFELPLSFQSDDLSMQAVVELQRRHPGVEMRFYQTKGIVLGLFGKGQGGLNIDEALRNYLGRAGHLRTAEGADLTVENFLAQHEAFLRQQGLDPQQMEKEVQEARMKDEAMSVGQSKPTEAASSTPTEPTP